MGLGGWPDVSIAEARERAGEARKRVRDGVDPIDERAHLRYQPGKLTVAEAIESCFAARRAELKDNGKAGGWLSPVTTHVIPKLGTRPIEHLDQHMLKSVLAPIWHEKPSVAKKVLYRMNVTLIHAAALGIDVDLQAPMKAKALLGRQRHTVTHVPSIPYPEAPAFYQMLCEHDLMSCFALRFLMLTATRTSEVRFATYDEIDGDVWTIPAERMKAGREHRVPLTDEAFRVMELAKQGDNHTLLFPSPRGNALSNAAMAKFMKDRGYDARPHGFRSSFRVFAEEMTDAEFEVKEAALGHQVDNETVRAYQRSDRLDKRRVLMDEWATLLIK